MDIGILRNIKIAPLQDDIVFEIGTNPPIFDGLNELVQIFLITVITDPGTDAMDTEFGAGLASILTTNFDPNDTSKLEARINVIFAEAERQMLTEQDGLSVPNESRLQRVIVHSVNVRLDTLEVEIEFSIENVLGQRAFVRV
jgi:hypothetical protein